MIAGTFMFTQTALCHDQNPQTCQGLHKRPLLAFMSVDFVSSGCEVTHSKLQLRVHFCCIKKMSCGPGPDVPLISKQTAALSVTDASQQALAGRTDVPDQLVTFTWVVQECSKRPVLHSHAQQNGLQSPAFGSVQ